MREAASFIASQSGLGGGRDRSRRSCRRVADALHAWNSRRKLATLCRFRRSPARRYRPRRGTTSASRSTCPSCSDPGRRAAAARRCATASRGWQRLSGSADPSLPARRGSKRRRTCYRGSLKRSPDAHRDRSRHPARRLSPDRLPDRHGRSRHPPRRRRRRASCRASPSARAKARRRTRRSSSTATASS